MMRMRSISSSFQITYSMITLKLDGAVPFGVPYRNERCHFTITAIRQLASLLRTCPSSAILLPRAAAAGC
jgi:hypothetical protein